MGNLSRASKILDAEYGSLVSYVTKDVDLSNLYINLRQQLVDAAEDYVAALLNDPEVDARTKLDLAKFILKTQGKTRGWSDANSPQIVQNISTTGDVDIRGIFGI